MRVLPIFFVAALLQGCVTAGYEGEVGNQIDSDQMEAQREANRSIAVIQSAAPGYQPLSTVSARRCHRSFVEEEPDQDALIADLKRAAFVQGADAISDISQTRINGLMANCWYVIEASATTWIRQ